MPRTILQSELDEIVRVVASFAKGASLREISDSLQSPLERRSLQRRLALLAKKGRIQIVWAPLGPDNIGINVAI